ncbi:hypothetical protein [Actinoplanes teichomyceticus]|uniref:DUF5666 domain-containing protein n=1 Tax=Actinoplanes teichomyceticus TaxID=1867 RepID=A0A561W9X0_ACTTI|nr:hypothetical protein [Actinoplanes teichomyceticus]TWG20666.1 hypothetical protein FHX34_103195 [Actinoplanes teichomyceticus]GIF14321.1 hypothetical protein Ate01nite_43530 [Actinoplanes teichomyceticus]
MRMRRIAVAVAMTAAVTVPVATTGVMAYAAKPSSSPAAKKPAAKPTTPATAPTTPAATPTTPAAKKPAVTPTTPATTKKPTPAPVKKVKVAFAASGRVTAVGATSVTVAVKGGTKDVKGRTVTIGVPASVRVLLNGKRVAVTALAAGHQVSITGTRVDAVYTAAKVQATGKVVKPTPVPSTSTSPAPVPSSPTSPAPTSPAPAPSAPAPSESAPEASPSPSVSETPAPEQTSAPEEIPVPEETSVPEA